MSWSRSPGFNRLLRIIGYALLILIGMWLGRMFK